MPSARSTQPRLVTEPTTKPMLAAPRHSRMPTCTRWIGCCALAPAKDATSVVAAIPARVNERRMKKSPADECAASRESGARRNPGACCFYATRSAAVPDLLLSAVIPGARQRVARMRARWREPGISRLGTSVLTISRFPDVQLHIWVWSCGPSRNDETHKNEARFREPRLLRVPDQAI